MQTVNSRRFFFLGGTTCRLAAGTLLAAGLLGGCSSAPVAQAPVPVGSLAARDAAADVTTPPGILSMAAGDRLGMAVYARNIELARAKQVERTRYAQKQSAPITPATPTVASADE
ncbi:MAG: hypothetical protein JSS51_05590 [Planctomycetes bacterium]|nr:hypothetical protein [Planctomycetota bacterium]